MKETVKAAAVQFGGEWLAPEANAEKMAKIVEEQGAAGVELVVFPELASSGYFSPTGIEFDPDFVPRYHAVAETLPGPTSDRLARAAAATGVHLTVGVLERDPLVEGTIYNSMALIGPDGLVGVYRKIHLPVSEKFYFCAGHEMPVFDTPLGRIGMSICYDGRFPELARTLTLRGAEIICSGWAVMEWPEVIVAESQKHRAYTRAQENGVFYLAANRSGVEGETTFMGHSAIAGPSGKILAYSEVRDEEILHAELRAEELVGYRQTLLLLNDRRPDLYGDVTALAGPLHTNR